MKQEKHKFTVLSDKVCIEKSCSRRLKLNVVERKRPHNVTRCYKCGRSHRLATQHAKSNR